MGAATIVAAVGAAYSAYSQKSAANKATKAQQQGAAAGREYMQQMYDRYNANAQPYMQVGQQGLNGLTALLNGNYSGFYSSPDYMAARDAMTYAMDRSAAARGGLYSGGYQVDLSKAQGDLAAQYLGNYRNWLGGVAGMGAGMVSGLGSAGLGVANSMAGLYQNGANAQALGYAANGAQNANLASQLSSLFSSAYGAPAVGRDSSYTQSTYAPSDLYKSGTGYKF